MSAMKPTEELLRRARGRDREAFDTLVDHCLPRLMTRIQARLGERLRGKLEAEDVLQETLAVAWRTIEDFRWQGEASLYSWLFAIAERAIWNASQKRSWNHLELKKELTAPGASPSRGMRREERLERLEDALRGLSADHRKALTLARLEGMAVQDIAGAMRRSPNAVSKLIARALAELRKSFGDTESLHLPDREISLDEDGHED